MDRGPCRAPGKRLAMNDRDLLKHSIRLARENSADGRGGPFGAVVVREGTVVGTGVNRVVMTRDPTAHAEILAIRDAADRLGTHLLADCIIYCSCEPCPMCLAAIYWSRIPKVVFAASGEDARWAGFDDSLIAGELILPWEARSLDCHQDLQELGREVLQAWIHNPRKQDY